MSSPIKKFGLAKANPYFNVNIRTFLQKSQVHGHKAFRTLVYFIPLEIHFHDLCRNSAH